jgi:aryl-alcohol dehydrogenase-like predicted oxidoreductase
MRMRRLGNTGLVVSEMCFGAMTFSDGKGMWEPVGSMSQSTATELLKTAFEAGINFLDTANVYSNGISERMTGDALKDLGLKRDEVVIATKVLGRMGPGVNQLGLSRAHILKAVDDSLRRLQTDYIDLYQIHGRDPLTPLEETLEALDDCVRAGKVRYLGLCNLPAWEIAKSLWISDKRGLARFESAQMYYSLVGRDLEREVVPVALDQRLAILPWSPLAGGFMTGKYSRDANDNAVGRRAKFDFPPVDRERGGRILEVMQPIAHGHGASLAQVALAWLLHQPHVTSIIIGVRTRTQLEDNLKAVALNLADEELAALDEVSALPSEYPGWMLQFQPRERLGIVD